MVTAELKTENVIAAKAGVSNYIVKPFNAQTLKNNDDAVFGQSKSPQRQQPEHTTAIPGSLRHTRQRTSPSGRLSGRSMARSSAWMPDVKNKKFTPGRL